MRLIRILEDERKVRGKGCWMAGHDLRRM